MVTSRTDTGQAQDAGAHTEPGLAGDPSTVFLSVIVVTYNSAATVLETLDSLLDQGPLALELVVCDDGSTDRTLELVNTWVAEHRQRFSRVLVLGSDANLGICRNLARGIAAATGQWLKPIAGDDHLMPGAAQAFAEARHLHQRGVVIAAVQTFSVDAERHQVLGEVLPSDADARLIDGDTATLLDALVQRNPIPAPGYFVRRSALADCGGLDMAFTHLDDWPLWIRMLRAGHTIAFLDRALVMYRVATSSISTSRSALTVNARYLEDLCTFYALYQKPRLGPWRRLDRAIEVARWRLAAGPLRARPALYAITRLLFGLSPLRWAALLRRR